MAVWSRPLALIATLLGGRRTYSSGLDADLSDEDWSEFETLVTRRHRVAPAICEAFQRLSITPPHRVGDAIAAEARENGLAALARKAESLRLATVLADAGINAVWLKGWPLAEQLFGTAGMRQASDIDILVRPDEREAAARLLLARGYVAADEHALRARILRSRAVGDECKDVQYVNPGTGQVVELHWRCSHFRGWPEFGDLGEPPVSLATGTGATILVPGPAEQLAYLSGHGVQHFFGRLKWLLDISRLAEARGVAGLESDLARAGNAGAGRAVRLSLNLAARVFGSAVPGPAQRLSRSEERWTGRILAAIGDPDYEPGTPKARLAFYIWHLQLSETRMQAAGVIRYALWRRVRLGLASLTERVLGRAA